MAHTDEPMFSDSDEGDITEKMFKLKVVEATQRNRDQIWNAWTKFQEIHQHLRFFADCQHVTKKQVMKFIEWYAFWHKHSCSSESLVMYVWVLNKVIYERTDNELCRDDLMQLRSYCKDVLQEKFDLRSRVKDKITTTVQDLEILLQFLWKYDPHVYAHERMRVQSSWAMKIMMFTGARPGAIAVSEGYRNSNLALTYRNLHLQLIRDPDNPEGRPLAVLTICFSLIKGARSNPMKSIKVTVREDRNRPWSCPILELYAMAEVDQAFKHFKGVESIINHRLQPGQDDICVAFKDEMLSIPLVRKLVRRSEMSPCLAASTNSLSSVVANLSIRAGFVVPTRLYDLRRGAFNVLQAHGTEQETRQVMGHSDGKSMQYYISKHSRIDLQGAIVSGASDQRHVDHVRSGHNGMRAQAPYTLKQLHIARLKEIPKSDRYMIAEERFQKMQYRHNFTCNPSQLRTKAACEEYINSRLGALSQDDIASVKEFADAIWEQERLKRLHRRRVIKQGRLDWFEETLKTEATAPNHQRTSPNQAIIDSRASLAVLLFPEAPLEDKDIIALVTKLVRLCRQWRCNVDQVNDEKHDKEYDDEEQVETEGVDLSEVSSEGRVMQHEEEMKMTHCINQNVNLDATPTRATSTWTFMDEGAYIRPPTQATSIWTFIDEGARIRLETEPRRGTE